MKCDQRGNIWVTAPGGVWVYAMNGDLLGKVRVPELVANLSWGGADFRTLFMTATHSIYTVTTKIGPRAAACRVLVHDPTRSLVGIGQCDRLVRRHPGRGTGGDAGPGGA